MKDIEHVEMSGISGWFMLQPGDEILNKRIGWLTTHATLSNNLAKHRARYQRCMLTGSASFLKGGMFSLPEVFQCNIVPGLRCLNFSSLVPWTFSCRVMHEFGKRGYPAPQNIEEGLICLCAEYIPLFAADYLLRTICFACSAIRYLLRTPQHGEYTNSSLLEGDVKVRKCHCMLFLRTCTSRKWM